MSERYDRCPQRQPGDPVLVPGAPPVHCQHHRDAHDHLHGVQRPKTSGVVQTYAGNIKVLLISSETLSQKYPKTLEFRDLHEAGS